MRQYVALYVWFVSVLLVVLVLGLSQAQAIDGLNQTCGPLEAAQPFGCSNTSVISDPATWLDTGEDIAPTGDVTVWLDFDSIADGICGMNYVFRYDDCWEHVSTQEDIFWAAVIAELEGFGGNRTTYSGTSQHRPSNPGSPCDPALEPINPEFNGCTRKQFILDTVDAVRLGSIDGPEIAIRFDYVGGPGCTDAGSRTIESFQKFLRKRETFCGMEGCVSFCSGLVVNPNDFPDGKSPHGVIHPVPEPGVPMMLGVGVPVAVWLRSRRGASGRP